MQSLLSLGEDMDGDVNSNRDHVIENGQPIESNCWLNHNVVAMATYILNTCPIHCRYVRRGRGQHNAKTAKEFFVTSKQVCWKKSNCCAKYKKCRKFGAIF